MYSLVVFYCAYVVLTDWTVLPWLDVPLVACPLDTDPTACTTTPHRPQPDHLHPTDAPHGRSPTE